MVGKRDKSLAFRLLGLAHFDDKKMQKNIVLEHFLSCKFQKKLMVEEFCSYMQEDSTRPTDSSYCWFSPIKVIKKTLIYVIYNIHLINHVGISYVGILGSYGVKFF
jgi:hypothetical protein